MGRILLIINAALWIPYGLYCFFVPEALAANAGVGALSKTGSAELRAMYGGLQIAVGALAAYGVAKPEFERGAVTTLLFLTLGLGLARLCGAALDEGFSAYTGLGLLFEFGTAALASLALRSPTRT